MFLEKGLLCLVYLDRVCGNFEFKKYRKYNSKMILINFRYLFYILNLFLVILLLGFIFFYRFGY